MRQAIPILLGILLGGLIPGGCAPRDEAPGIATLAGQATYRERMAVPPGTRLEVSLRDVSNVPLPGLMITSISVSDVGQPPYTFEVPYRKADIHRDGRYVVSARLVDGDRVLFETASPTPVLTRGAPEQVELLLRRAAAGPESSGQRMRGMYSYLADAARFVDCATGRSMPVAQEAANADLQRGYLNAEPEPGSPMLVIITGRIVERVPMDGGAPVPAVVPLAFHEARPGQTCATPTPSAHHDHQQGRDPRPPRW